MSLETILLLAFVSLSVLGLLYLPFWLPPWFSLSGTRSTYIFLHLDGFYLDLLRNSVSIIFSANQPPLISLFLPKT